MGNAIAETRLESKARGVQKTRLCSEPPCLQKHQLTTWESEAVKCVYGWVGGWVGGRVLPVPICSPLSADPPRSCGKKKNMMFEVCILSSHLLPQGRHLVLVSRWWQSPSTACQRQPCSAPGEIPPRNPLLKSRAGQWSSADGIVHRKVEPSSCSWVLGTWQGGRRPWSGLAAACCAVLAPWLFSCGLQHCLLLPWGAEEQSPELASGDLRPPLRSLWFVPQNRISLDSSGGDSFWKKDFLCQIPGPQIKMRLQLEHRLSITKPSGGLFFPIKALKPGNMYPGVLSSSFPQYYLPLVVVIFWGCVFILWVSYYAQRQVSVVST